MTIIGYDEFGSPIDDGFGEGTSEGGTQTGQGGANAPNPPVNDSTTIKNRTAQLRTLYWKYLFRLPTQDEFNGMALANGLLTDEDSWKRVKDAIPNSQAAELAMREVGGGKPNTRTVPSGYDFGSSKDYDPAATGPATTPPPPGGAPNLDKTFLLEQIRADAKKQGITLTPESEEYWIGKASKPDLYSDGKWRVGWNPYWASRLDGRASSDPRLAGDAGIVPAPAGYVGGGSSESGTASSAETPAARAARLATFGLGPEGLQNQKPGEMPPAPTMGDMLGQQGPIADPGTYTPGEAYNAPDYMAPAPFAAPTAADMGQDPGYQFRLTEGQKALERSGAARGVTNTGGNMKGLLDYGQRAASQEYGNVYDRSLNTYNTNAANAFQQYSTNALKNNAFNTETEGRKSGAFGTNTNLYQQQQMNAYNQRQKAYDDAMAAYQTKFNNQRQYERDRANDLFRVAGI